MGIGGRVGGRVQAGGCGDGAGRGGCGGRGGGGGSAGDRKDGAGGIGNAALGWRGEGHQLLSGAECRPNVAYSCMVYLDDTCWNCKLTAAGDAGWEAAAACAAGHEEARHPLDGRYINRHCRGCLIVQLRRSRSSCIINSGFPPKATCPCCCRCRVDFWHDGQAAEARGPVRSAGSLPAEPDADFRRTGNDTTSAELLYIRRIPFAQHLMDSTRWSCRAGPAAPRVLPRRWGSDDAQQILVRRGTQHLLQPDIPVHRIGERETIPPSRMQFCPSSWCPACLKV